MHSAFLFTIWVCVASYFVFAQTPAGQTGCNYRGKTYKLGERFGSGWFAYECANSTFIPGLAWPSVVGCANPENDTEILLNGDEYRRRSFLMKCIVTSSANVSVLVEHHVVACLDSDGKAHANGSSWLTAGSSGAFHFEHTCVIQGNGGGAKVTISACNFNGTRVEPGCYRLFTGDLAVWCLRNDGGLRVHAEYAGTQPFKDQLKQFPQCSETV